MQLRVIGIRSASSRVRPPASRRARPLHVASALAAATLSAVVLATAGLTGCTATPASVPASAPTPVRVAADSVPASDRPEVTVDATPVAPGTPPPSGPTGGGACRYAGRAIPCHDPLLGWYDSDDSCYWNLLAPQPPTGDPLWLGHLPTAGSLYTVTCESILGLGIGLGGVSIQFSAATPPGFNDLLPLPEVLALRLVATLPILGPTINTAPGPLGAGLVGLPVWMWTPRTLLTWGPITASISVAGVTVSVTLLGQKVDWSMGDGSDVTCQTVGTPYAGSDAATTTSPTCGYVYPRSSGSQPGGRYTITAATTWNVAWTGAGTSGNVSVIRSSTSTLKIDELQVVTQ